MLGISGLEALVIIMLAAVLIGPSRLPELATRTRTLLARIRETWRLVNESAKAESTTLLEGTGLEDLNPTRLLAPEAPATGSTFTPVPPPLPTAPIDSASSGPGTPEGEVT